MPIRYKSTRGQQCGLRFEEVVLGGLATDKGLYIPESIPAFSSEKIEHMRSMTFSELAYEVISSFVQEDDIPAADLKRIINTSFQKFRTPEVAPSIKLNDCWVLELFHGPTFAFKDVALQFLGNIFEYFLKRGDIQKSLTILGATSGDTGSAAIHGLRGKANVHCFIMFPTGKVTEIQEKQMTTIPDENIHCLSVKGDFDDCQAIVKSAFADADFKKAINLGAVNSINWARVLAQITYYFYSYLRVTDGLTGAATLPKVSFAVPTGNFGDILAGYFAKRMGLAVDKLVVCTNENNVLHRFFTTGKYSRIPAVRTIAPSMDISISSNFERYLYYLAGESSATLSSWMKIFESTGEVAVPSDLLARARLDFVSSMSDKAAIVEVMKQLYAEQNYLVCPHTATAFPAVPLMTEAGSIPVCLATAHPAKFEEAVHLAMEGKPAPARPAELQSLFGLPERKTYLNNSLKDVQQFILKKLPQSAVDEKSGIAIAAGKSADSDYTFMVTALLVSAVAVTAGIVALRYFQQRK